MLSSCPTAPEWFGVRVEQAAEGAPFWLETAEGISEARRRERTTTVVANLDGEPILYHSMTVVGRSLINLRLG